MVNPSEMRGSRPALSSFARATCEFEPVDDGGGGGRGLRFRRARPRRASNLQLPHLFPPFHRALSESALHCFYIGGGFWTVLLALGVERVQSCQKMGGGSEIGRDKCRYI